MSSRTLPIAALIVGPMAMGASPIFVRLAEVGPFASAFWRVALALPVLLLWWRWEAHSASKLDPRDIKSRLYYAFWPGVLFAGDLFFWHLSIMNTTVANATFFATLAPIVVVFGAALFLNEALSRGVLLGLGVSVLGAALLLGSSVTHAPERLSGDIFGLVTAVFFGAYILSVKTARKKLATGELMFLSTMITSVILLGVTIAAQETLWPQTWRGAASLFSLALVSQVGGQGLLAYALGHLPAIFSSIVVFLEPLSAAALGWLVLLEPLSALQSLGGVCVIAGIYIARPRR